MILSIASIRKQLAFPKTSWQICLLAIIGGCASALLVVLFTLTIEEIHISLLLHIASIIKYNQLYSVNPCTHTKDYTQQTRRKKRTKPLMDISENCKL